MNDDESRRGRRRQPPDSIAVVDTMTDRAVGRLGNLSETGMLLIASVPLVDDALYQFRFNLGAGRDPASAIEVGAHLLWQDNTSVPGQTWTGFRFITLLDSQLAQLREWLRSPEASHE